MRKFAGWLAAGAALVALGGLVAADGKDTLWKPVLPEADLTRLVDADAKLIKDALAKGDDKKAVEKARIAALMIALYAQSSMGRDGANAKELASLRDSALKVATALGDGKVDEAKKGADDLSSKPKAVDGAKTTAVELQKGLEADKLMKQFAAERAGGLNLEKDLIDFQKKKKFAAADYDRMVYVGYKTALIGELTEALAPDKDEGKKKKKDWVGWSEDMRKLGVDVAEAAKSKKDKELKTALGKLNGKCTACHDVFRD